MIAFLLGLLPMFKGLLGGLFKFMTNPSVMIAIACSIAIWWAVDTKTQNMELKQTVAAQTIAMSSMSSSQKIMDGDIKRLDNSIKTMAQLQDSQKNTNEKLAQIPNTSKDAPFLNPELLQAARTMRSAQTGGK